MGGGLLTGLEYCKNSCRKTEMVTKPLLKFRLAGAAAAAAYGLCPKCKGNPNRCGCNPEDIDARLSKDWATHIKTGRRLADCPPSYVPDKDRRSRRLATNTGTQQR